MKIKTPNATFVVIQNDTNMNELDFINSNTNSHRKFLCMVKNLASHIDDIGISATMALATVLKGYVFKEYKTIKVCKR